MKSLELKIGKVLIAFFLNKNLFDNVAIASILHHPFVEIIQEVFFSSRLSSGIELFESSHLITELEFWKMFNTCFARNDSTDSVRKQLSNLQLCKKGDLSQVFWVNLCHVTPRAFGYFLARCTSVHQVHFFIHLLNVIEPFLGVTCQFIFGLTIIGQYRLYYGGSNRTV